MIDIREKKIFVANEEQSIQAQEKLFKLGCEWIFGNNIIQYTQERFLYIDKNKKITWSGYNKVNFDKIEYEEIYFNDLMKMKEDNSLSHLIACNIDLSVVRISEFMEYLEDNDLLNEEGINLKTKLWETYIKDTEEN